LLSVDTGVLAVYLTTAQDSVITQNENVSGMLSAATGQQTRHTKRSVHLEIKCNDKEKNNKLKSESV
jgi:hypothetical protein